MQASDQQASIDAEQIQKEAMKRPLHGVASIRRVVLGECNCGWRCGAHTPPAARAQLMGHIRDFHQKSQAAIEIFKAAVIEVEADPAQVETAEAGA